MTDRERPKPCPRFLVPLINDQHDLERTSRLVVLAELFERVREGVLHLGAIAVESAHLFGEDLSKRPVALDRGTAKGRRA